MKLKEFVEQPEVWNLLRDFFYLAYMASEADNEMQEMFMMSIADGKRNAIEALARQINPNINTETLFDSIEKAYHEKLFEAGPASEFTFGGF